jgi:hypothetical protein
VRQKQLRDRVLLFLSAIGMGVALAATSASAQSSGSFNYDAADAAGYTACVLNGNNGTISGGEQCATNSCTTNGDCTGGGVCYNPSAALGSGVCIVSGSASNVCASSSQCSSPDICLFYGGSTGGGVCAQPASSSVAAEQCIGNLKTAMKTSSGNGNVFVIRPSAVIGLLTDVTIKNTSSGTIGTSSAYAGVDFTVNVKPLSGQAAPTVLPTGPVTYDARFIQISSNLFSMLSACTTATPCYITFNESTVSAHSFDWVASSLSSGNYGLTATWTSSLGDFGIANSMTCVGPVNFTVEQNKIFQPSAGISF